MLNCAVIMGRLTADPELRQTPNGISVTRFTVAVDRGYVKAGEERKADFINVIAWRQTAEFVSKYFSKGSMIAVQGSIQTRSYEDKMGNKRTAVEVVADNVSFCGSKAESGTAGGAAMRPATAAPAAPAASFSTGGMGDFESIEDDDDSLPF
jgi:single-strand DNA-binding protein